MRRLKQLVAMILVVCMLITLCPSDVSARTSKAAVKSVTVTNLVTNKLVLKKGTKFRVKPRVVVTGKISKKVTYVSSNKKIVTVDNKGVVKAVKSGKAVVAVKSAANPKVMYRFNVYVGVPTKTVKLSAKAVNMFKGTSRTLKASIAPKNATYKRIQWSSSDKRIATVSSKGVVKAVKVGRVYITAKAMDGSGKYARCKITVKQPVTSIKLSAATLTITEGSSKTLTATVAPASATNKTLSWTSSNKKIATVSAKGVVKAIAPGTATITAKAADGSGKKAVCKVTVKAPITSLKFSKISGRLYVGKTMQLSPVIKPAYATNKKCAWSSSNDKVAMVNSEGKVYAVAAGTAVITAKATDGTGKKATYKVTVAKANTIASATVSDPQTVQVTLSGSQKLPASSFVVKASTVLNGTYNYTIPLDGVTTKDNKTYTIALRRGCSLSDYVRVCVYVDGLYGTGKSSIETYYSKDHSNRRVYMTYELEQNESFSREFTVDRARGICKITVDKLPDGVKYAIKTDGSNAISFSGTVRKTGTTKTTIKSVDELGDIVTYIITWNVSSSSVIAAYYIPQYGMIGTDDKYYSVSVKPASVAGGSGKYTYSIDGDDYGLSVDITGRVTGKIYQEGTYNLKVKITDDNDTKISTTVNCEINAKKAIKVEGYVKDINGNNLNGVSIKFYNQDKATPYKLAWNGATSRNDGSYSMDLFPGTYKVVISIRDDSTYLYNQKFDKSETGRNFVSDVLKLTVNPDNAKYSVDDIGAWYDEYDRQCGTNGYVYLVPGTSYTLKAKGMGKRGVITAKVDRKAVSVTAKMSEDVIEIGDKTSFYAEKEELYKFVPKTTGTYYFYSISTGDPYGYLYDENRKILAAVDDVKHDLSTNKNDFCMSYKCVAGKTYYISVIRSACDVYISTTNPKSGN